MQKGPDAQGLLFLFDVLTQGTMRYLNSARIAAWFPRKLQMTKLIAHCCLHEVSIPVHKAIVANTSYNLQRTLVAKRVLQQARVGGKV